MLLSGKFTFLGFASRTSSKSGNSYTLVNVCDTSGASLNCMVGSGAVGSVTACERFKDYIFDFEYNPQFKDLRCVGVAPVK